jgi:hypothetical protein
VLKSAPVASRGDAVAAQGMAAGSSLQLRDRFWRMGSERRVKGAQNVSRVAVRPVHVPPLHESRAHALPGSKLNDHREVPSPPNGPKRRDLTPGDCPTLARSLHANASGRKLNPKQRQ